MSKHAEERDPARVHAPQREHPADQKNPDQHSTHQQNAEEGHVPDEDDERFDAG